MKKSEVEVGMAVTLTEPLYGEHFGRSYPQEVCREHHIYCVQPGTRGIVVSVDVPVVCHTKGSPMSFVCVDFIEPETGCRFRVRPWYSQIRKFTG
jgi:hypothetical protein